ncbi:hypothetical protein FA95DRAFT_1668051, partial [Auriscalpium vulgare]
MDQGGRAGGAGSRVAGALRALEPGRAGREETTADAQAGLDAPSPRQPVRASRCLLSRLPFFSPTSRSTPSSLPSCAGHRSWTAGGVFRASFLPSFPCPRFLSPGCPPLPRTSYPAARSAFSSIARFARNRAGRRRAGCPCVRHSLGRLLGWWIVKQPLTSRGEFGTAAAASSWLDRTEAAVPEHRQLRRMGAMSGALSCQARCMSHGASAAATGDTSGLGIVPGSCRQRGGAAVSRLAPKTIERADDDLLGRDGAERRRYVAWRLRCNFSWRQECPECWAIDTPPLLCKRAAQYLSTSNVHDAKLDFQPLSAARCSCSRRLRLWRASMAKAPNARGTWTARSDVRSSKMSCTVALCTPPRMDESLNFKPLGMSTTALYKARKTAQPPSIVAARRRWAHGLPGRGTKSCISGWTHLDDVPPPIGSHGRAEHLLDVKTAAGRHVMAGRGRRSAAPLDVDASRFSRSLGTHDHAGRLAGPLDAPQRAFLCQCAACAAQATRRASSQLDAHVPRAQDVAAVLEQPCSRRTDTRAALKTRPTITLDGSARRHDVDEAATRWLWTRATARTVASDAVSILRMTAQDVLGRALSERVATTTACTL